MVAQTLSGCAVPIKEETFYTDAGQDGAILSHFFSTDSSVIGKAAWDSIREGMTCMGPDAIGDIKAEIEKLCTKVACTQAPETITAQNVNPDDVKAFKTAVFDLSQFLARLDAVHAVTQHHQ